MKVYSRKKKRINIFALNVDEIGHFKEISVKHFSNVYAKFHSKNIYILFYCSISHIDIVFCRNIFIFI